MAKLNFPELFQTMTQVHNGELVLNQEDKDKRYNDLEQLAQGIASNMDFAYAFIKTCQEQVRKIKLSRFNQLKNTVDGLIEEGLDATSAWLEVYSQTYPYKSVKFLHQCEATDSCTELQELFDFAMSPDVAKIAKELYC